MGQLGMRQVGGDLTPIRGMRACNHSQGAGAQVQSNLPSEGASLGPVRMRLTGSQRRQIPRPLPEKGEARRHLCTRSQPSLTDKPALQI